jgi:hypothetical protein
VLLEREEELAAIDAAITDALAGAGRLVVIEGPSVSASRRWSTRDESAPPTPE